MIQYRCDLNDHLEHSRPPQFRFFSSEDFILNPNLVYRRNGGVPPLFADRIMVPGELDCSGPTVWAEDPFTKIIYPYKIHGTLRKTFENFCLKRRSGSYNPAHIHALQVRLFSLLNPLHLRSLQKYFRELQDEGWLRPPVDSVRLRMTRHNDPIATFFHLQMRSYFSNLMSEEYKPSFCVFATHLPGSKLWRHTDRPQGDLVCSLLIDYHPETDIRHAWPLYLTVPTGHNRRRKKALKQRVGDAVAFRGIKVPHSRPRLPQNHRSSHILFCFVPAGYTGPLD